MFTNLAGGWIGARSGLKKTLLVGLCLQIVCLGGLIGWQEDFSRWSGVVYVVFFQALGGIAKDLVKVAGKSTAKITVKEGETDRLLKYISRLTGLKNSFKGFGHFWGTLGIVVIGYWPSLVVLIGMLIPVIVTKKKNKFVAPKRSSFYLFIYYLLF